VAEQDSKALAEAKDWNHQLLAKVYPNGLRDPFALELCGDIAAGQKQWAAAEACYKEAYDAWEKSPIRYLNLCAEKLVPVLQAQGKSAEAEIWKKKIPQNRDPM
jgi:predicted Zn-dependent protease